MNDNFLTEIAGISAYNKPSVKVVTYNSEFFGKLLNDNQTIDLQNLLSITQVYPEIIRNIDSRYNNNDNIVISQLLSEIKEIEETINKIVEKQNELFDMKIKNDTSIKEIYSSGDIDLDTISKLRKLNSDIDSKMSEYDSQLLPLINDKKEKNNKLSEIGNKEKMYEELIESGINRLSELLKEVEGKKVFDEVDLDNLKQQYEQGLTDIIPNPTMRKSYTDYVFSVLKQELNMMNKTVNTANKFVNTAKKENNYDVSEISSDNDQIATFNEVDEAVHHELLYAAERSINIDDKTNDMLGNSYDSIRPLVDGIYNYIAGIPAYLNDRERSIADYNKLLGYYEQAMNYLSKTGVKDIINEARSLIGQSGYLSVEKSPYKFAAKVFNIFNSELNDIISKNNKKQEQQKNMDSLEVISDEESIGAMHR